MSVPGPLSFPAPAARRQALSAVALACGAALGVGGATAWGLPGPAANLAGTLRPGAPVGSARPGRPGRDRSITLLFAVVSVPWMDQRMRSHHPEWATRMRATSALIPWPRRR